MTARTTTSDDGGHSVGEPIIGKGEFYGTVETLPEDFPNVLTGTWMIEGLTIPIVADSRTEFSQEKGAFAEGALIKVEFVVLSDGTFLAREIKSALSPSFGDDDDHEGDGHHDGYKREGHAYGAIESIEGEIWSIGGMTYTVNANTKLHAEGLTFEPGVMVKVEYKVDADGNRIAKEIEAKRMGDGSSSGDTGEVYGFVTDRPTDSYLGPWTIGSLVCEADSNTRFEQEHGTLDGSPFAEVKYVMQDGNCLIIETRDPCAARWRRQRLRRSAGKER